MRLWPCVMQRLAIYDMDKTITRKATFAPFIAHVIRYYARWPMLLLPLMGLTSFAYVARLISRSQLKEWNLCLLLGGRIDRTKAAAIAQSFARETFGNNVLGGALGRIACDKADGYRIILATASYRLYVEAIAERLGIADVIATELVASDQETLLPRIDGSNCYDVEKLNHIRRWMAQQGLERCDCYIRFYSDHISDAPCLEFADEAFATNPHAPLRTLARERGWVVFDWV
jgi:HAD superfamily hydrolase (TIGR01490 family)